MFSAVISEHFSENRMIISLVAAKIWYPKNCAVFFGPPCMMLCPFSDDTVSCNLLVITWIWFLFEKQHQVMISVIYLFIRNQLDKR